MTSQGHAYAIFRRALDSGNVTAALGAAGDLPQVGLTDALELCLLLLDKQRERYETAALRWHGRYCRETRGAENGVSIRLTAAAIMTALNRCLVSSDLLSRLVALRRRERREGRPRSPAPRVPTS